MTSRTGSMTSESWLLKTLLLSFLLYQSINQSISLYLYSSVGAGQAADDDCCFCAGADLRPRVHCIRGLEDRHLSGSSE